MRLMKKIQRALREEKISFKTGDELDEMGRILDSAAGIEGVYRSVLVDITDGQVSEVGRAGFNAERVVRLGIVRKRLGLSYRELSEATADSLSVRRFLNLRPGEVLSRSAIHGNLKRVSEGAWEQLNACLIQYAIEQGYEDGGSIRTDTTTVETHIHYPTDASLLNDSVRVLCRAMGGIRDIMGPLARFTDHRHRAKRKLYRINNARKEEQRYPYYLELLRVTRKVVTDAERLLQLVTQLEYSDNTLQLPAREGTLKTYIPLVKKVIEQAYRRVVKKEQVPSGDKIVSIFEPHTDIIVKGFRDVVFGHKVCLTTGRSCLILGLSVLDGNPKDSTLVPEIVPQHRKFFTQPPHSAAFDGCFASHDNRDTLKAQGVKNITFSKNLGMKLESLVSHPRVHKALMNFRSGIEGCISFLKRIFSFDRFLERTSDTFKAVAQLGAAACNLTLLARFNIARTALT